MKRIRHIVRSHGPRFMKFGLSGGLGAIVDFSGLFVLTAILHVDDRYAVILSSVPALIVVFLMNKHVTFRASGKAGSQVVKFGLVYAAAFLWNGMLSLLFLAAGLPAFPAKFLAIGCVAMWNYCLLHSFVFRGHGKM
ncbi:MAG: hypothetical protein G01um101425_39 [Candidatus Peregrinibacteria bacterium Gr01-1014_25]|nr:MAG: hypothetical protein G01um101425_39 [Candidatus Peregrinibacteria bacterium Gr01-1014_25]